jgi:hypothetical protein
MARISTSRYDAVCRYDVGEDTGTVAARGPAASGPAGDKG